MSYRYTAVHMTPNSKDYADYELYDFLMDLNLCYARCQNLVAER